MLHVAFCFDRNYQQHFGAAVTSLLLNFDGVGEDLCIHVVTDAVDGDFEGKIARLRNMFRATINIHVPSVENMRALTGLPVQSKAAQHLSPATYYRLLLADLLPGEITKVLYLDSDMVVLSSIRALFDEDMGGKALAVVADPADAALAKYWSLAHYFNSGVALLDLRRWRELEYARKCLDFSARNRERIHYGDQCSMNVVLADDIHPLAQHWNMPVWHKGPASEPDNASIIHYITADKPWLSWYRHPSGRHYWRFLDVSPWSGAEPVRPGTRDQARKLAKLQYRQGKYREAVKTYVTGLMADS